MAIFIFEGECVIPGRGKAFTVKATVANDFPMPGSQISWTGKIYDISAIEMARPLSYPGTKLHDVATLLVKETMRDESKDLHEAISPYVVKLLKTYDIGPEDRNVK